MCTGCAFMAVCRTGFERPRFRFDLVAFACTHINVFTVCSSSQTYSCHAGNWDINLFLCRQTFRRPLLIGKLFFQQRNTSSYWFLQHIIFRTILVTSLLPVVAMKPRGGGGVLPARKRELNVVGFFFNRVYVQFLACMDKSILIIPFKKPRGAQGERGRGRWLC